MCQFSGGKKHIDKEWAGLKRYVRDVSSDLVLLPEMPFYSWFTAIPDDDPELWFDAVKTHQKWLHRLEELGSKMVIGTIPINTEDGKRNNVAFVWANGDIHFAHTKYYLPNETGFWEATWFQRGEKEFLTMEIDGIKLGFLICTELWFMNHARDYGEQGIHFLVCPRSTPKETTEKWIAGGKSAAVISGSFCISSNHYGVAADNKTILGGAGWISDPEGEILGITSVNQPYVTIDVNLKIAEKSKLTYPRYVSR